MGAALPDPLGTNPSGRRRCVISSPAANEQEDVFAAFGAGPSSRGGDLGPYRLTAGADHWERRAVTIPALLMEGAVPVVSSVAASRVGSLFALAHRPERDQDGAVLRSLGNDDT